MENQEIIITVTIILVLVYFYWQNQQKTLTIQPINNTELQELQNQVRHYQKLYQQRVEKDLTNEEKIKELNQDWETRYTELESLNNQQAQEANSREKELQERNQLYQQKVTDLETSLLNLAKQKIKGKQEATELLEKLENNLNTEKEALTNQITELGGRIRLMQNNYKAERDRWGDEMEELKAEHQEQLRKINLLFDEQAGSYENIDFNGLYSLLENVKAERERESKMPGSWRWN